MTHAADSANIARHLDRMAAAQPDRAALKIPRGRARGGHIDYLSLSFAELSAEVDAWCARLTAAGVRRGDRTLVMVRPGLPLIAAAFALFRLGAVPVVIDPGMGLKSFLACVERSRPVALVGIPLARVISRVCRRAFATVRVRVAAASAGAARLADQCRPAPAFAPVVTAPDELAAILFTSGSTGAPKGVRYTHGMFAAQVELIRETYGIQPGEVDLPMLPVFALFNPALGMTTVVPEIDPSRPATVDPKKIIQAIQQEGVTSSFGSPTLWGRIAQHCHHHGVTLPTMRRVLCAGAPVPPWLWEAMDGVLPNGTLHSPYGATEVLPVSSISAPEVLGETALATLQGRGTCVGRVLPANRVKVIAPVDGPIATLAEARELPPGEIGEIIVTGPSVTRDYDALPDATARAKIADGDTVWHRMGDAGRLDDQGRLWFCGRLAERVFASDGVLHTEQIEPHFLTHAEVRRCALVGVGPRGQQRPAVVIEPIAGFDCHNGTECRRLTRELRTLGKLHPLAERIRVFYFHPKLPVDVRHNAKIHRLTLAKWAASHHGFESDPKR